MQVVNLVLSQVKGFVEYGDQGPQPLYPLFQLTRDYRNNNVGVKRLLLNPPARSQDAKSLEVFVFGQRKHLDTFVDSITLTYHHRNTLDLQMQVSAWIATTPLEEYFLVRTDIPNIRWHIDTFFDSALLHFNKAQDIPDVIPTLLQT